MFRMLALILALGAALAVGAAVPAHAAPSVESYGRLPAMGNVSLSPSGARYAYITVDHETRKLVVANVADNSGVFVSSIGTAKVVGVFWAGEDHLLIDVSHTANLGPEFELAKQELSAVLVLNLSTKKVFSVFTGREPIVDAVFGYFGSAQLNGRWYGYFGGNTRRKGADGAYLTHGYADLYRVDLDTGEPMLVAHGAPDSQSWLVSPTTGEVVARSLYDDNTRTWSVVTGGIGGRTLLTGHSPFGGVDLVAFGKTDQELLVERPDDKGPFYQETPLSGAAPVKVGDETEIAAPLFDRTTRLWIGTIAEGDRPRASLFDARLDQRMDAVARAFPGKSVELQSFSPDFSRLVVFTTGTGDSGTYWLVDVTGHHANPLGYAYPDAQAADVGTIEMVDWKAADGTVLHGVLSLPPGREPKNLPVVVLPHGGPQARDYPVFDWWQQAFASRGYAVFQPNFRGSDGYGQAFRDAGFGQWGRKMQTDVSDGLAELARRGIVDPKRACIVGASYGGYAALAGVTVQHGLYRCAVAVAGVSNLSAMIEYADQEGGPSSAATRYWKKFMGVTSAFEGELAPITPVKLVDHADAPILLIHGRDDTVVPFRQSLEMDEALKRAGKVDDFVIIDDADHWYLHEDARLIMVTRSVGWVETYNPPDPPPVSSASAARSP